jgi:hypothetical protein
MMVTLKNRISPSLTVEVHPRHVFNVRNGDFDTRCGNLLFVVLAIDYPRKRVLARNIHGSAELNRLPPGWFWSA